jgi:kumamolisin
MSGSQRVPLNHSIPDHPDDDAPVGRIAAGGQRAVTIVLQCSDPAEEIRRKVYDSEHPLSHRPYTPDEARAIEAPAESFEIVERFAREQGLEVVSRSHAQHNLLVRGTVGQLEAAFGVKLEHFKHAGGVYQSHRGPVYLPPELERIVEDVIGLDDTPRGRPLFALSAAPIAAQTFSVPEIAQRYRFPQGDGSGQRIAILSFGGGYYQEDLDHFFETVLGRPGPKVTAVSVADTSGPGPTNDPFPFKRLGAFVEEMSDPDRSIEQMSRDMGCALCWNRALATLECTMDIEIAGAVAPGAAIDVYFARDTPAGVRAAFYAAAGIGDAGDPVPVRQDDSPVPQPAQVISVSWGFPEAKGSDSWLNKKRVPLPEVQDRDIAICCASGDLGSLCVEPGPGNSYVDAANVSFPASSPYVLACGGTAIRGQNEEAWNDPHWKGTPMATGGGVSGFFACPPWQSECDVPPHDSLQGRAWLYPHHNADGWSGRGVPDVAANAGAGSGYQLYVGGREAIGGGTSAAAPLWAGLIALLNQSLTAIKGHPISLGHINMYLYRRSVRPALRGIDQGHNRLPGSNENVASFEARPGWNGCTGLGVPDGDALLEALRLL